MGQKKTTSHSIMSEQPLTCAGFIPASAMMTVFWKERKETMLAQYAQLLFRLARSRWRNFGSLTPSSSACAKQLIIILRHVIEPGGEQITMLTLRS